MPTKKMSLRYAGTCRGCGSALAARTTALYDSDSMTVSCLTCGAAAPDLMPSTPVLGFDRGVPGAGPQREYERRRANRQAQIDERWGRLASMVRLMSNEPPSTTAWRTGAEGERALAGHVESALAGHVERALAEHLERALGDSVIVLHSRRVPHSAADIDHLVVAPSGIWIVDAKRYEGRVERRDVGTRREPVARLFVDGRDRTRLVDGLERQVRAVRSAIEPLALTIAPLHPVLAFVGAEWGLFAKPFDIDGVRVMWPKRLAHVLAEPGPWTGDVMDAVARQLAAALPPKA